MPSHFSSKLSSNGDSHTITLPKFTPSSSPSTKWLLNTFRNSADHRLIVMLKEKPKMFRHYFQVRDSPPELRKDPHDTKPLFGESVLLYLRPLSLAVYMRCPSAVKILLDSKCCNSNEYGYAYKIYVPLQNQCKGDLLEFSMTCLAVRRQFYEALPIIFHSNTDNPLISSSFRSTITMRFMNSRLCRINRYDDILQYAFEMALVNRSVNIAHLLDILIHQCTGFYNLGKMDESRSGRFYTLFRRLAHMAVYYDKGSRVSTSLIKCMSILVHNSHFQPYRYKNEPIDTATGKSVKVKLSTVIDNWKSCDDWLQDCCICAALLFLLYTNLLMKHKTAAVSHACNLLYHMLYDVNALNDIFCQSIEQLATVLDFLLSKDIVGRQIIEEKKPVFFKIIKHQRDSGDIYSSSCGLSSEIPPLAFFKLRYSILSQVINRLKTRDSWAKMRQLHILSVTDKSHSTRRLLKHSCGRNVSVNTNSPSSSDRWLVANNVAMGCNASTESSTNPNTHNIGSKARVGKRIDGHMMDNKVKCAQSIPLSPTISNLSCRSPDHRRSVKEVTVTKNEGKSYANGLVMPEHPESVDCTAETTGVKEEKGCLDSCTAISEFTKTSLNAIKHMRNTKNKMISSKGNLTNDFGAKGSIEEQTCVDFGDITPTFRSNKSMFKSCKFDYLSLEEVDHLIDCITTTALTGQESLEGKLIEDLFNVYLDCGLNDSSTISRTNSRIGAQVYVDQEDVTNTIATEQLPYSAEANLTVNEGEYVEAVDYTVVIQNKVGSTCLKEVENEPSSSEQQLSNVDELQPSGLGLRNLSSETLSQALSQKQAWSCSKPLTQLNNVLGALRQLSYGKRR